MADRVSASISIGGALPRAALPDFIAAIIDEGLSTEWDGEEFSPAHLPTNEPLHLMAHEVAWGRFEGLEAQCIALALPFARWSGAYPGQWSAERVVFSGTGDRVSYACDEEDRVTINRDTVERLGGIAAIRAYFAAADFAVPPLCLTG